MAKLSAKTVEKALPKEKEYRLADGGGLYLRIRPSGAKSWLFLFRLAGFRQLLRMTLGSLEDISLKEARVKLPELRKLVATGMDPRKARAAAKIENIQALTMQTVFDAWLEFIRKAHKDNTVCAKRHEDRWRIHLKAALGKLLIRDVGRAHLAAALDVMTKKGIREETRKALSTLNLMMDYALTRHLIEQNPARILKPKDFSATANRPRDRILNLAELRQLWLALDQALIRELITGGVAVDRTTIIAIKVLILTGARRGEVAGMPWSELDFESKIWQLPSKRTKNRQAHTIYLSDFTISLIKSLGPSTGKSVFVFNTGRGTKQQHICEDSLNRAIDRLRKRESSSIAALGAFTIHNLRRSAATAWGEYLKTDPHVIERMLNHQPLNKLVATYQRATYAQEQKAAWLAWGEMVENKMAKEPNKIRLYG
jgi:integrase